MKLARFVLKIIGASLAFAGLVCLVVAFWDKIAECCESCCDKVVEKCTRPSEYDDFADVPEY